MCHQLAQEPEVVVHEPAVFAQNGKWRLVGRDAFDPFFEPIEGFERVVDDFVAVRFALVREVEDVGVKIPAEADEEQLTAGDFLRRTVEIKVHDDVEVFVSPRSGGSAVRPLARPARR